MSIGIINTIRGLVKRLDDAKPSRFAYTAKAFTDNDIEGVTSYDINREMNIPVSGMIDTSEFVVNKGLRAEGASIPRMMQNHFMGRLSFNIAKMTEQFLSFIDTALSIFSHNAFEYSPSSLYRQGDCVYLLSVSPLGRRFTTLYVRVRDQPFELSGVSPIAVGQGDWMSVNYAGELDAHLFTDFDSISFIGAFRVSGLIVNNPYWFQADGITPIPNTQVDTFTGFATATDYDGSLTVTSKRTGETFTRSKQTIGVGGVVWDWGAWKKVTPSYSATLTGSPTTPIYSYVDDGSMDSLVAAVGSTVKRSDTCRLADNAVYAANAGGTTGNAVSATRLQTARSISGGGDTSGGVSFDGSGNVIIPLTVNVASKLRTPRNLVISGASSGSAMFDGTNAADINISMHNPNIALFNWSSSTSMTRIYSVTLTMNTRVFYPSIGFCTATLRVMTTNVSEPIRYMIAMRLPNGESNSWLSDTTKTNGNVFVALLSWASGNGLYAEYLGEDTRATAYSMAYIPGNA